MKHRTDILIRTATTEDVEDLSRLYLQLIPDAELDSDAMRDAVLRMEREGSGTTVFVAELDGRVVGTLQSIVFDNLVRAPSKRAVLESFVVDETVRGQGVGSTLLEHVMAELKRQGCVKVLLGASPERCGAQRLYDKVGFQEFGKAYLLTFDSEP